MRERDLERCLGKERLRGGGGLLRNLGGEGRQRGGPLRIGEGRLRGRGAGFGGKMAAAVTSCPSI